MSRIRLCMSTDTQENEQERKVQMVVETARERVEKLLSSFK